MCAPTVDAALFLSLDLFFIFRDLLRQLVSVQQTHTHRIPHKRLVGRGPGRTGTLARRFQDEHGRTSRGTRGGDFYLPINGHFRPLALLVFERAGRSSRFSANGDSRRGLSLEFRGPAALTPRPAADSIETRDARRNILRIGLANVVREELLGYKRIFMASLSFNFGERMRT